MKAMCQLGGGAACLYVLYACASICVSVLVCVCICLSVYMYACMHVCACLFFCVCACICLSVCLLPLHSLSLQTPLALLFSPASLTPFITELILCESHAKKKKKKERKKVSGFLSPFTRAMAMTGVQDSPCFSLKCGQKTKKIKTPRHRLGTTSPHPHSLLTDDMTLTGVLYVDANNRPSHPGTDRVQHHTPPSLPCTPPPPQLTI